METQFFHSYASLRKSQNTIWELKKKNGEMNSTFQDLSAKRVNYFKGLYAEPLGVNITEIVTVSSFFNNCVSAEQNEDLTAEISKELKFCCSLLPA
jgi:hypothetical protein